MLNEMIAKKQEYASSLESRFQDYKSKLEEDKITIFSLNREKESLQNLKNEVDCLKEEVKAKKGRNKSCQHRQS